MERKEFKAPMAKTKRVPSTAIKTISKFELKRLREVKPPSFVATKRPEFIAPKPKPRGEFVLQRDIKITKEKKDRGIFDIKKLLAGSLKVLKENQQDTFNGLSVITKFLAKVPPVEDLSDVELRKIGDTILETSRKLLEEKGVTEQDVKDIQEREVFDKGNELVRILNQKFIGVESLQEMKENQSLNLIFHTWLALKPLDVNKKRHVFGLKGTPILTSSAIKQIKTGEAILDIESRTLIKAPLTIMPKPIEIIPKTRLFMKPPGAPKKTPSKRRRIFKP